MRLTWYPSHNVNSVFQGAQLRPQSHKKPVPAPTRSNTIDISKPSLTALLPKVCKLNPLNNSNASLTIDYTPICAEPSYNKLMEENFVLKPQRKNRVTSCVNKFLLDQCKCPTDKKVCGRNLGPLRSAKTATQQKKRIKQNMSNETALSNIRLYRAAKRIKSLKSWCLHNRFDILKSATRGLYKPNLACPGGILDFSRQNHTLFDPYATAKHFSGSPPKVRRLSSIERPQPSKTIDAPLEAPRPYNKKSKSEVNKISKVPRPKGKADGLAIIPLTTQYKKSIIRNMIKERKVPEPIIEEERKKVQSNENAEAELDKMVEAILNDYDVILQDKALKCMKENETTSKKLEVIDNVSILQSEENAKKNETNESKEPAVNVHKRKISYKKPAMPLKVEKPLQATVKKKLPEVFPVTCGYTYETHPINVTIKLIDKFVSLVSKAKAPNYDIKGIVDICRRLKIGKVKLTAELMKSKEAINEIKERVLRVLFGVLNKENGVQLDTQKGGTVKYFVGNGNNGALVKIVMKERWWWTQAESSAGVNILWTPWKKRKYIESLSVFSPVWYDVDSVDSCSIKPDAAPKFINVAIYTPSSTQICNHLEGNVSLGNKKGLYQNLSQYCENIKTDIFDIVPLTFHIRTSKDLEQFKETFKMYQNQINYMKSKLSEYENNEDEEPADSAYKEYKSYVTNNKNIWIVKPGENTNRGKGIFVTKDLEEIEELVSSTTHTSIIQKYIERPLLIHQRKFDIRCFALLTSVNGFIKGYFYQEGYLRTSSKKFSTENLARAVHLTNEAVQIKYDDFGKFEPGNKISYSDFQAYLTANYKDCPANLGSTIVPQIKKIIQETIRAVYKKVDPKRRINTFELFGYDFMIDEDFKVLLIEANINPCLGVTSPFSARFVSTLVDNTLKIALDPLFPPPADYANTKKYLADILPEIRYELIFDQRMEGAKLDSLEDNSSPAKEHTETLSDVDEECEKTSMEDEDILG